MEYSNILFEREGAVGILTINRPEKYNALNRETRSQILAVLNTVEQSPDIAVLVVTGAGEKAFVAGADIREMGEMGPLEVYAFAQTLGQRLYTRFEELPIPVIAMINGLALGGGLEMAMACDFRIASTNARLGQPEINLGFLPSGGGTQRLGRLVGTGRARQMIYTGDAVTAEEACRIGLVNEVAAPDQLRSRVMELAQKIASRGRTSLSMCKRSILFGQEAGLYAGLAYETLCQVACFAHPDKTEGVNAFLEKRQPDYQR